ncbi:hypothetical protein EYF80_064666 [Liparis tanakae]|uniref:Uncharacterized protein n=1 Tax=Liparis tanakae TaxID=230148 RepID=A0A4Z2E8G3_9TELE|nr:hypothetical protein EYF80_064666 [Liparis tanakae]
MNAVVPLDIPRCAECADLSAACESAHIGVRLLEPRASFCEVTVTFDLSNYNHTICKLNELEAVWWWMCEV